MSPPNALHGTKLPKQRRSRIALIVHALLVGVVVCAAGAGAVGGPAPGERDASAAVFRDVKRAYQTTARGDTSALSKPRRLTLVNATPTSVTVSWRSSDNDLRVAGYEVYLAGRPTMQTTETSYTITHFPVTRPTGLAWLPTTPSATVAYRVDLGRDRGLRAASSAAPPPPPPPPPPSASSALSQSHPVTGRRCVDLGSGRLDRNRHEREPSFDPLPGRWCGQVDGVLRAPPVQR